MNEVPETIPFLRFFNPGAKKILTDQEVNTLTDAQLEILTNDFDCLLSDWLKHKFRKNRKNRPIQLELLRDSGRSLVFVLKTFGLDAQAKSIAAKLDKLPAAAVEENENPGGINITTEPSFMTRLRESDILTKIRSWNDYFNMMRLVVVFIRATTVNLLRLGEQTKLVKNPNSNVFEKVTIPGFMANIDNNHFGVNVTPKKLLDFFKATQIVTDSLSVAIFLFSFLLTIMKVTIQAMADSEEANKMDTKKRALHAFQSEDGNSVNHIFWGLINFITNFSEISGFSESTVCIVLCLALLFDAAWTLRNRNKSKNLYEASLREYRLDLIMLGGDQDNDNQEVIRDIILNNMGKMIVKWQAKDDTYIYSTMTAALLLVAATVPMMSPSVLLAAGVATTILFPIVLPIINIVCNLLCQLAVCLYLTTGDFHTMRAKKRELDWYENAKTKEFDHSTQVWTPKLPVPYDPLAPITLEDRIEVQNYRILQKEYAFARNLFLLKLTLYFVVPLLAVGLTTVCWVAAAILGPLLLTLSKKIVEYVEESQNKELELMRENNDFEQNTLERLEDCEQNNLLEAPVPKIVYGM